MTLREELEGAIGESKERQETRESQDSEMSGKINDTATKRLNEMMNPHVVSVDEENKKYVVGFEIEDWMLNQRAELHGGICSTAFDIAAGMGAYILSGKKSVATVDMYVNFISRMPGDENLEIEVRLIKAGRSFIRFCADGHSTKTGKLIATAMVTYAVLQ